MTWGLWHLVIDSRHEDSCSCVLNVICARNLAKFRQQHIQWLQRLDLCLYSSRGAWQHLDEAPTFSWLKAHATDPSFPSHWLNLLKFSLQQFWYLKSRNFGLNKNVSILSSFGFIVKITVWNLSFPDNFWPTDL